VAEYFQIDELKRRVAQAPESIAFAQLAEALRRAGRFDEAVEACRAGLVHHPDYLSAHVTLGRALIEQGDLASAETELTGVLAAAPENLAAVRGLAEIHERRGEQGEALTHYRRALTLAPHDPDLEETVSRLAAGLDTSPAPTQPGDEASGDLPGETPTVADVPAGPTPAARQVEALERWLDAIMAGREPQA
jgi:tetratricopeptide (TPR) repeat protein